MMKKTKINASIMCLLAFILCSTFIFIFLAPSDVSDAILPVGYVDEVIDNGYDWWTAEEYINVAKLKATVDSFKLNGSFDFAYLKENPIIVAVIDTGVNIGHEIFTGKYDENGNYDAGAVDSNGVGLYDVILRDSNGKAIVKNAVAPKYSYKADDVTDDESRKHGTHVAGIIATLIHSLDLEQYIKILPIKASWHAGNDDKFASADVKSAIDFAISQGADVVNMSLSSDEKTFGGVDSSEAYKNTVLVAAAGNEGKNVKRYPAGSPNVIGVMNYTMTSSGDIVLSDRSNYGVWDDVGYDVCAPGIDIFSADGNSVASGDYKYKALSGTSMSSPIVAFGTALLAMKDKALAGKSGKKLSSEELAARVREAYSSVLTVNESGKNIGEFKVFDINTIVPKYEVSIDVDETLLQQRLGSIKPIKLKMNVSPSVKDGEGEGEWYIDGVRIGNGFEIEYMPKSEVGSKTIAVVFKCDGEYYGDVITNRNAVELTVDYMLITAESVSGLSVSASAGGNAVEDLSKCELGKKYHFEINGLENLPASDADRCWWFVNDEFKSTGSSFDFTPSVEGEYKIKIKLNGFESSVAVLKVSLEIPREIPPGSNTSLVLIIFTVVAAVTVGAIALAVITVIVIRKKKNKPDIDGTGKLL